MDKFNLDKVFNAIGDCVCITDKYMIYQAVNQNFANLYNKEPKDMVGKHIFDFYPNFERSVFYEGYQNTINTGETSTRIGFSSSSNKSYAVRTFLYDEDNIAFIASEMNSNLQHAGYVSSHDSLTSLYNRHYLEDMLNDYILDNKKFSLVILDILKFKSVNESFGNICGDLFLMEAAARLKKSTNKESTLFRINSNTFAILIDNNNDAFCIETIKNIHKEFEQPFNYLKNSFKMNLAVGYILSDE